MEKAHGGGVFTPGPILMAVLPVYLLIVFGALMRWLNVARSEHDQPVMHVVFHVMYPCFILDKILGSAALRQGDIVGWSFGIGFVEMPLGLLVGILAARLLDVVNAKTGSKHASVLPQ